MKNPRDLAEYRSNLYTILSSIYIQIPEKKTLFINWEPAYKLLEFPQRGAEKSLKEIEEGLRLIRDYVSRKNLSEEETLVNLSKDWTRLLRGVDIKGPLPPYESLYRAGRLQEKPAQEIYRLFSKMGIRVPEEWHQPSDYIGVELDFMHLLCEKERREVGALGEVMEVERAFIEDHLGQWVPLFCEKMLQHANEDYYRGIARLTIGLVAYDRAWLPRSLVHPST
jgi:TorA maturation chaperone TorD